MPPVAVGRFGFPGAFCTGPWRNDSLIIDKSPDGAKKFLAGIAGPAFRAFAGIYEVRTVAFDDGSFRAHSVPDAGKTLDAFLPNPVSHGRFLSEVHPGRLDRKTDMQPNGIYVYLSLWLYPESGIQGRFPGETRSGRFASPFVVADRSNT
jgi:hypothetical protein